MRVTSAAAVLLATLFFILTSCPANRDGMPGQLASAKDEAQSAARSAALALQLWTDHRSTRQLASVQLADARDEVVKAHQGIAVLAAHDPVDVQRQALLAQTMTELINDLNAAAALRALPGQPDPRQVRQHLLDVSAALESEYR
ncbi:MAG: hypothetical protein U0R18_03000 [Mycobacterium sp.]